MKRNIYSTVVHERLNQLGLEVLPAHVVACAESELLGAFECMVARKLDANLVTRGILKPKKQLPRSQANPVGQCEPKP